jgi:hypothetical protein
MKGLIYEASDYWVHCNFVIGATEFVVMNKASAANNEITIAIVFSIPQVRDLSAPALTAYCFFYNLNLFGNSLCFRFLLQCLLYFLCSLLPLFLFCCCL